MQRVPGLIPIQKNKTTRTPVRSRVQSPDPQALAPRPLQPVARPVDTFHQAKAPDHDEGLASLAQALAQVNPEIKNFMEVRRRGSRADALELLQTTDPAEIDQRIRSGDVPRQLQTMEGMRVFAENRAYRDAQEFARRYNEDFARGEGDIGALFAEVTAEAYQTYGDDDTFMDVYTATIEPERRRLFEQHQTDATELELAARRDNIFGAWAGRVDSMLANGEQPALIVQSLFANIPDNHDFLLVHPREQQQMLLQLAAAQAERGNYDMARAILTMERQDGAYRGSLVNNRTVGPDANRLMGQIHDAQAREGLRLAHENSMAGLDAQVDGLLARGMAGSVTDATIPDAQGNPTTVTRETLLNRASQRVLAQVQADAQLAGIDLQTTEGQAAAYQREKIAFVENGLEHPSWFNTMEGAFGQMTLNTVTSPTLPANALEAFRIWRDLDATAPNYLTGFLKQDAYEFFDVANMYLEYGMYSNPEDALRAAQQNLKNFDVNDPAHQQTYWDLNAAVTTAVDNSTGWLFGPPAASNDAYIRDELNRLSRLYARSGLGTEAALAQATANFNRTHMNVMGTYIRRDRTMPGDFAPLAEQYVREFAGKHRLELEGLDADDLTITPASNGVGGYVIVERATGMYAITDDMEYFFDFGLLGQLRDRNTQQTVNEVVEDAEENRQDRESVAEDYRAVGVDPLTGQSIRDVDPNTGAIIDTPEAVVPPEPPEVIPPVDPATVQATPWNAF